MKYLLILALLFMGCTDPTVKSEGTGESMDAPTQLGNANIYIIRFRGCQYMYVSSGDASWGSHMGNCDNPIHGR